MNSFLLCYTCKILYPHGECCVLMPLSLTHTHTSHAHPSYAATYTQDGPPINPLNTAFTISDPTDNNVRTANISITNTPAGVMDQLFANSTPSFMVTSYAPNGVIIQAPTYTAHTVFMSYLQDNVFFWTNDVAFFQTRNLSLVMTSNPGATSAPVYIPIYIIHVNLRPLLNSTQRIQAPLLNYLPDTNNTGFLPSFLINRSNVDDRDPFDIIGLDIFNASNGGVGVWQYWSLTLGSWANFPAHSECSPLFVNSSQYIRFLPTPSVTGKNGSASIQYRAWDGSSVNVCINGTLDTTSSSKIHY